VGIGVADPARIGKTGPGNTQVREVGERLPGEEEAVRGLGLDRCVERRVFVDELLELPVG
jgi:hypothetical protein